MMVGKPNSTVKDHFDLIAKDYDFYKKKNKYYYDNLKQLLIAHIPRNKRILEIGCGTGDLLNNLKPAIGYGMDLSGEMIRIAKRKYKKLHFSTSIPRKNVDYIFMSDVIEHLDVPQDMFKNIASLMDKNTLLVNTMANPIWEPFLMLGEKLGYKMPEGKHKRISMKKIDQILKKNNLKIIKHGYTLLLPIEIPILTKFVNKYLERYFKSYAFIEYFVAKKV